MAVFCAFLMKSQVFWRFAGLLLAVITVRVFKEMSMFFICPKLSHYFEPNPLFILLLVFFSLLSFLAKPNLPKKKKLLFSIRAEPLHFLTVFVGFNLVVPISLIMRCALEHRFPT